MGDARITATQYQVENFAATYNPAAITIDNLAPAFIGMCFDPAGAIAIYDLFKIESIVMDQAGVDRTEALDYIYDHLLHNWLGEYTPKFMYPFDSNVR